MKYRSATIIVVSVVWHAVAQLMEALRYKDALSIPNGVFRIFH